MLDVVQACNSALLANINRDHKSKPEPYQFKDFLLFSSDAGEKKSDPVILENGMTISEFKTYMYLKALAERSKQAE